MNDKPVMIPLDWLLPNPYQVRQAEDTAAVDELAENIQRNGLLQPPVVRSYAGGDREQYQLAFGHTRLAAYKSLKVQSELGVLAPGAPAQIYAEMPCVVRELDDLQMFELAVAENIKRRDLNPVERAAAMQTYMETFKKTSAETGEFFNIDEATVRGTVRLLNLPEAARVKLAAGEITVGAARSLLALTRIDPEKVDGAMKRILEDGHTPEDAVIYELKSSKQSVTLQESYDHTNPPHAGKHFWKLELEPKKFPALPALTTAEAQDAGAIDKEAGKRKKEIKEWISSLESGLVAPEALIASGAPEGTIEKLAHLVHPPACSKCSYYLRADDVHLCAWKSCYQRKRQAWERAEAEKVSQKLDIPIYDPEKDGKEFVALADFHPGDTKLFEEHVSGLRLRIDYVEYSAHDFTKSHFVGVVDVTPEAVAAQIEQRTANEQKRASGNDPQAAEQRQKEYREMRQRESNSHNFINLVAAPVFASILEPIKNPHVLMTIFSYSNAEYRINENEHPDLYDEDGDLLVLDKAPDIDAYVQVMRCAIVECMFQEVIGYELPRHGPLAVAECLVTLAAEWDVSLPADWLEKAGSFVVADEPAEEDFSRQDAPLEMTKDNDRQEAEDEGEDDAEEDDLKTGDDDPAEDE